MKRSIFFPLLLSILLLSGCMPTLSEDSQDPSGPITIGTTISVDPITQLTFKESKEALAADGLYYATWTDGDSVPYENSDGETVDLYDAQVYFLAGETLDESAAKEDCATWLAAAKTNYQVVSEKDITANEQSYHLLSYTFADKNSPYDRGISAFGTNGKTAVCIELTCVSDYSKDLEPLLLDFLDNCHYSAE